MSHNETGIVNRLHEERLKQARESETFKEQLSRLHLIASGDRDCDMSDNDLDALRALLMTFDQMVNNGCDVPHETKLTNPTCGALIGQYGAAYTCLLPKGHDGDHQRPFGKNSESTLIQEAMAELDAILHNERKCFAEDSDADEFLGHVTNARIALAKTGHPLLVSGTPSGEIGEQDEACTDGYCSTCGAIALMGNRFCEVHEEADHAN